MVAEVVISPTKKVVIQWSNFKGQRRLDIRIYITSKKYSGPTKRGINIPENMIESFVNALNKVLQE